MTGTEVTACRKSLARFMREAWHVVEPGRNYVHGWHIPAMALHAEGVSWGAIRDMLVTIPPGTSKSRLFGVYWPAWHWLTDPATRFLFFSNAEETADETSLECRRLVESPWYRLNFGITWALQDDQNTKGYYQTTVGGSRQALGINSRATGKKGDIVCVDDANDAEKVESAAERKRVINRYDKAIHDRVIDFSTGRHVVIGQRTHEDDLIGHLKRQGGWFELCIPEEYDPARRFTSPVGWTDPRTQPGALLRPHQFTAERARRMRRNNLLLYQAKHLQAPRNPAGIRFKRAWLDARRWTRDPDGTHVILRDDRGTYRFHPGRLGEGGVLARFGTADSAASTKRSADYTVISSWAVTHRFDLVWLGCRRVREEIPEQPAIVAEEYRRFDLQWVCVEAVFANVALYQLAARSNMVVRRVDPAGSDKLAHATPAIILAEAGRLYLPDEDTAVAEDFPIDAVVEELTSFTGDPKVDKHDDVIDTLSYAVDERNHLDRPGGQSGGAAVPVPQPGAGVGRPVEVPRLGRPPATSWHGRQR